MSELPIEITCQSVRELLTSAEDMLLLDCREEEEHAIVTLEGAKLLPMSELAERRSELAGRENLPLVVYCHHGMRSNQVAVWLRGEGFSLAQSMAGGIDAWAVDIDPGMTRY